MFGRQADVRRQRVGDAKALIFQAGGIMVGQQVNAQDGRQRARQLRHRLDVLFAIGDAGNEGQAQDDGVAPLRQAMQIFQDDAVLQKNINSFYKKSRLVKYFTENPLKDNKK